MLTILNAAQRSISRLAHRTPLRSVLIFTYLVPILGTVGLVGYLSFKNGQQAVAELANQLMEEVSKRVEQQLQRYLDSSEVIIQMNAEAIQKREVNVDDPDRLSRLFWRQRFLFNTVCGSAIYYGNPQGEFTGLGMQADRVWRVGRSNATTQGVFYQYIPDDDGIPRSLVQVYRQYDARERPWFKRAMQSEGAVWSDVYPDFSRPDLKIALSQALYDEAGQLQGVIGVDCILSSISEFLSTIPVGQSGQTFILDHQGNLIGGSAGRLPFHQNQIRLQAVNSNNPIIQATTQHLYHQFGDIAQLWYPQQSSFWLDRQQHLVRITPFFAAEGIDWFIVVVVPKSDFTAWINRQTQRTILLCLLTAALATAFGLLMSRWITRPIRQLSLASEKIAKGELNQEVIPHSVQEVHTLANSFNWMSQKLQQSYAQLADYARSLEQKVNERTHELEEEIQIRVQAEANLLAQQNFLRNVIDVVPSQIFVKDLEGRYLEVNQATAAIYGVTVEELKGRLDHEFNPDTAQVQQFHSLNRQVMADLQPRALAEAIRTLQGELRWYQTVISPFLDPNGQVQGVIGSCTDVTDLKTIEAELRDAKEAAEAANRAKSTFLTNMSHELRSPLNAILGFAQLLNRHGKLTPDQQDNVNVILRSGEHLLLLINNVLDLSKIESGHTTLNESDFNLHHLLIDLENMFRLKAKEQRVKFAIEYNADVPEYISTDPIKLRQVLINLISNALKFTHTGHVIVQVKRMDLGEHSSDSLYHLSLTVEDTGEGMAAADLDRIFEAFVQTQSGQNKAGTGLGLAISRQFVQLMGGEITVRSTVGQGTVFHFTIQAKPAVVPLLPLTLADHAVVGLAADQPQYRILVVDDQADNRQLVIKLLSPLGFAVREADGGRSAIECWSSWRPHLIWMDMRMPDVDGFEATRRIRSLEPEKTTRIIALTASALEEDRAITFAAGCDDFVRKPCRESELFTALQKHLGVKFRFAHDQPSIDSPVPTKPKLTSLITPLSELSQDWLLAFQDALNVIDLDRMNDLLNQLENAHGSSHSDLVNGLQQQLDNFEYDAIGQAIGQALERLS